MNADEKNMYKEDIAEIKKVNEQLIAMNKQILQQNEMLRVKLGQVEKESIKWRDRKDFKIAMTDAQRQSVKDYIWENSEYMNFRKIEANFLKETYENLTVEYKYLCGQPGKEEMKTVEIVIKNGRELVKKVLQKIESDEKERIRKEIEAQNVALA